MASPQAVAQPLVLSEFFAPLVEAGADGVPTLKLPAAGRLIGAEGHELLEVRSPIDGRLVARVVQANEADIREAIELADRSRSLIAGVPAIQRLRLLDKAAELVREHRADFETAILWEAGKPPKDAASEVNATIERMELAEEDIRKINGEYLPGDWSEDTRQKMALVVNEPIGTVAAISSFNYPLFIPAAKAVPALLAGNAHISKPASATPIAHLLWAYAMLQAGFPAGVLHVMAARGSVFGNQITADRRVGMITFTGSTEVGAGLAAQAPLKPMHLELGGKGVAIIMDDADLDLAAERCVEGSLKNAGQRCDAVSLILALEPIADALVERLQKAMASWTHGDPREGSRIGPLISAKEAARVEGLVQDAVANGAVLLAGGTRRDAYLAPTMLDHVSPAARISTEETFGPVIAVMRVKNFDEAAEMARRTNKGLDSCVFTRDFYRMWQTARRLEVGEVTINDIPRHGIGYFPFGGTGDSGMGREGIGYSIQEMTYRKTVVFNLEPGNKGS
ncbi:MAG: aldehyde dehydrogenase family protein [Armatimonadota bacterium]